MMAPESPLAPGPHQAGWRKPRETTPGLLRYLETIRERKWLVLGVLVLTVAVAVAYLAHAEKTYSAKAELLITPISGGENSALEGVTLIRESSDPTRGVETGAALATTRSVGERVKAELGIEESVEDLSTHISATPIAASNLVSIAAEENSPKFAAEVANSYARNAVADRDAKLRAQLRPVIADLKERAEGTAGEQANSALPEQLVQLERLDAAGDPTIQFETKAVPPSSPSSPKPALTIIVALIGGLLLGVGAAFVKQALDPRLRREEQLRELYGLPILARVPRESKGGESSPRRIRHGARREPLPPSMLSPRALEAFRMLRTMLSATAANEERLEAGIGRAAMITGPSPAEGKTTTAINLATSYALADKRVILIEADFRRPALASALKVTPKVGIDRVLLGELNLEDALVPVAPFGDNFRLLPAGRSDANLSELLSMPTARNLLDDARPLADYVVIDSPPLTEVIDALPIAHYVDDLLIVTRLGMSSLLQLSRLADLLEENQIMPRGFVVVGAPVANEGGYYFESSERGPRLGSDRSPADPGRRGRKKSKDPLAGR
jgi:capsular exopolysaccharide synthesis family protein